MSLPNKYIVWRESFVHSQQLQLANIKRLSTSSHQQLDFLGLENLTGTCELNPNHRTVHYLQTKHSLHTRNKNRV
jgi:hypothetical protein